MKVEGWDCADGTPEEDHDWKIIYDWEGDPHVINGTHTVCYKKCKQCGKEAVCEEHDLEDYSDGWDD